MVSSELPADDFRRDPESTFYKGVLQALDASGVPVLVGGAYAFAVYTGIERDTKDFDLFLRQSDYDRATRVLAANGYETELKFPHWLGKVHAGSWCVDLIFNSGNGLTRVDDAWFEHATEADVLGVPAKVLPAEEMIWSKAFVMERERYDGADVVHLLDARAERLNWPRLLDRMGLHWRVLLSHLVQFGYIYPGEGHRIPAWVMKDLLDRIRNEVEAPGSTTPICRGTLVSREQYLHDVQCQGYIDARLKPTGSLSAEDIAIWTAGIDDEPSSQARG